MYRGMDAAYGTLTLIGSGEFGDAMGRVYRAILARAPNAPHAVFLDTPAGFELNADALAVKAADYFSQRLNLELEISSYRSKARASELMLEAALFTLRRADLILAGPGSPSYAVRNLQASEVWAALVARFQAGAHLVFASAAAIASSTAALPVYEIYKAGEELHWLDGLDLFALLEMNLAVIPHWNNSEGGTFDTRYCFMGEERFLELEKLLNPATTVLGIDEHTACVFDVAAQECQVLGVGSVSVRCNGDAWTYGAGSTFPFAVLRGGGERASTRAAPLLADEPIEPPDEITRYLMHVARALDETREAHVRRELLTRAHDTMHELSADWMSDVHAFSPDELAPYIELLLEIRRALRQARQYALADEIRNRLAALDIIVEDNADDSTWRRA